VHKPTCACWTQNRIAHNTRCTQILYPEWIVATFSVATVQLGHNFGIVTINGHNPINVDKNGSILFVRYDRISKEKMLQKMYTKFIVNSSFIVNKILWLQKYTFPLPGYIFGDTHKPSWRQFLAECTWLYTNACCPNICASITFQWIMLN